MIEDAALLQRFTAGDPEAFAELVRRRIDLVYSVALRQVAGDVHLAEDVTQQVFVDLARKASDLSRHPVISAWLFRSTQYAASRAVRTEQRRRAREEEAERMKLNQPENEAEWERLRPLLDDAMTRLADGERDVVALRFFEARSFAEIGRVLRVTEDAARKRTERALEKMRRLLAARGIGSTVAALSGVLANATSAAPIGLAAAAASAGVAAKAGSAGFATFFAMTKLQSGIAAAVVVTGAVVIGTGIQEQQRLQAAIVQATAAVPNTAALRAANGQLEAQAIDIMDLRRQDAELPRLRDEVATLMRLREAERTMQLASAVRMDTTMVPTVEMAAQLDRLPAARFRTPPFYPQALRKAGVGGDVWVEFTVDANGETVDVRAVKSTRAELEPAAINAVKQWEFRPGMKGKERVNTRMLVPILMRMEHAEENPPAPDPSFKDRVVLDPFHVTVTTPKPDEVLPLPPKPWF